MDPLLASAYNPEAFRQAGHALIDQLADYLSNTQQGNAQAVLHWQNPEEQLHYWQNYNLHGDDIASLFKDITDRSIHIHHPHYMGHQVCAPAPAAALAGLLSSFLNNGMAVYEMGAAATAIEKIVIDTFNQVIGYGTTADGYLTSGGTLANLTALLAARKAKAPEDVWQEGHGKALAVMVSEEAHYCIDRAARIMGLGAKGIIKIPVNSNYHMRTELLDHYYQIAEHEGLQVIAVIGSACSTSTGTYDDLEAIASFCEAKGLWFHVDGAHGGAAAFSQQYKHLVKGMERADSVAIDCHKMLMTPALATALLFKETQHSYTTFSQKAQYLWSQAEDNEWHNLAKRTFECTKLMMSIKFFTLLKMYGLPLFDANVTSLYNLARSFAQLIKNDTRFELALEPVSNIVCFRYVFPGADELQHNKMNGRIRESLLEQGDFYIVQTTLHNTVYLRTTLMNPFTTESHLSNLLATIVQAALSLEQNA
jgi:L-2,4-diaminobutyrate decarboxylase